MNEKIKHFIKLLESVLLLMRIIKWIFELLNKQLDEFRNRTEGRADSLKYKTIENTQKEERGPEAVFEIMHNNFIYVMKAINPERISMNPEQRKPQVDP